MLMIIVNSQGTRYAYSLLEHAPWNGCSLADLVFPFFLFIVGLSCLIHLNSFTLQNAASKGDLIRSIFNRSLFLFGLGLLLNAFPYHFNLGTLRVYGILQRIACCYFIASFIVLYTAPKTQLLIFLVCLWGYWILMTLIPVPGVGANQLSPGGSWVAYIDQRLFSATHLFGKVYDPEGLLSTIPSLATTLSGALAGAVLLADLVLVRKVSILICAGLTCLVLGWLWGISFPINKNLWTSSFVLWTSGFALIVFAFCFLFIDVLDYKKGLWPLRLLGMNALFAFVLHAFLLKIQALFIFDLTHGGTDNLRVYIADALFGHFSQQNASLFYAISFLFFNFLIIAVLKMKPLQSKNPIKI